MNRGFAEMTWLGQDGLGPPEACLATAAQCLQLPEGRFIYWLHKNVDEQRPLQLWLLPPDSFVLD